MITIAGVFESRSEAEETMQQLRGTGLSDHDLSLLSGRRFGGNQAVQPAVGFSLPDSGSGFDFEKALHDWKSVLLVSVPDQNREQIVNQVLAKGGAKAIRSQGTLELDHAAYSQGFEAAVEANELGHSIKEIATNLRCRFGDVAAEPAFLRGYERGHAYYLAMESGSGPRSLTFAAR